MTCMETQNPSNLGFHETINDEKFKAEKIASILFGYLRTQGCYYNKVLSGLC